MASDPLPIDEFELDPERYELRRGGRVQKLEKLPMELLLHLVDRRGQLVTREEIADRLWGKDVFVDTDAAINTAIRKIRRALGDDPERPRFLETVVGKGYRFVGPVTVHATSEPPSPPTQHATPRTPRSFRAATSWGLAIVGVALLGLQVPGVRGRLLGGGLPQIRSIAVLPLQNLSGDQEQEYFVDGMTDALIGELGRIGALRTISLTSAMHYKGTRAPLKRIARELNVDAVVEGTVLRSGARVRISARLVHAASDRSLWAESYERELRDVLALQRQLAQAMTRQIQITLTPQRGAQIGPTASVDPEAYQAYLMGRHRLNKAAEDEVRKAIDAFRQALARDPGYALAYAGLAHSYNILGSPGIGHPPSVTRPLAMAAARKALAIDDGLAEAHAALANVDLHDWRFADAERGFRRAIELNPSYGYGHYGLAQVNLINGRSQEAIAATQHAQELDPLSAGARWQLGYIHFHLRRYDDAVRQFRSVLELDPNYLFAQWFLGMALRHQGRYDEAIQETEKAVALSRRGPTQLAELATAYAGSGRRAEARQLLEQLIVLSKRSYVPPAAISKVGAALGEKDLAFEWLEKGAAERINYMIYIGIQPDLDPLRSDPRFDSLLRRVGLPRLRPPA